MERPVRAKFNTQIYEETCEWFIECRAGDLDDAARAEFDRWLRKSPEHLSAYLEIAAIWNEGPTLDPATKWDLDTLISRAAEDPDNVVALDRAPRLTGNIPLPPPSHDVATLSPSAREGNDRDPHPRLSRRERRGRGPRGARVRLFAVAASIILATVALGTYWVAARGVYATTLGEQRSLALDDGSTVQLNSLSKIRIRYTEHERTVDLLQGQALFHVAKDAARPFMVYSGETRVRAVGTQFDVYRKADGTVVTVVEGRVAVITTPLPSLEEKEPVAREAEGSSDPGVKASERPQTATPPALSLVRERNKSAQGEPDGNSDRGTNVAAGALTIADSANPEGSIFLSAGEQITVSPSAARRTPHPNLAGATAWTQRQLVFDSTTLADVAEEFNRYNERKLIIDPSALSSLHISGVFSSTDPTSLIRFLRGRPGLRIIETSTQIRVEKDL